jgi:hypothetical protein
LPPSGASESLPPRVPARLIVRRIDALVSGTATDAIKSYQINNRRLDRYPIAELLALRKYYAELAAREEGPRDRMGGRRIVCYL